MDPNEDKTNENANANANETNVLETMIDQAVQNADEPVETPPVETPSDETPPAETPPAETPPAETPPAETPPSETPPGEGDGWEREKAGFIKDLQKHRDRAQNAEMQNAHLRGILETVKAMQTPAAASTPADPNAPAPDDIPTWGEIEGHLEKVIETKFTQRQQEELQAAQQEAGRRDQALGQSGAAFYDDWNEVLQQADQNGDQSELARIREESHKKPSPAAAARFVYESVKKMSGTAPTPGANRNPNPIPNPIPNINQYNPPLLDPPVVPRKEGELTAPQVNALIDLVMQTEDPAQLEQLHHQLQRAGGG